MTGVPVNPGRKLHGGGNTAGVSGMCGMTDENNFGSEVICHETVS